MTGTSEGLESCGMPSLLVVSPLVYHEVEIA